MKKFIVFFVVIVFAGLNDSMAQVSNLLPIPTYNYYMTNDYAAFQELGPGNQTREKRDMNVEVTTSSSDAAVNVYATVWIVKKNNAKVLGPFIVYPNELLSVKIDGGKWGVIINCEWDVNVSVWIDTAEPRTLNDFLESIVNPFVVLPELLHSI